MSSARSARSFLLLLVFCAGCNFSTAPSYVKRDIEPTIEKILLSGYKTEAHVRLVGGTLYTYVPVDILYDISKRDPKQPVKEQFEAQSKGSLLSGLLSLDYLVKQADKPDDQEVKLNKDAMKKLNNAWETLRRVVFSMGREERDEIKFYVFIMADVQNGYEMRETIYYQDFIKNMYRLIDGGEFYKRLIMKFDVRPDNIGDRLGQRTVYKDVKFSDFLCRQMEHRIALAFSRPEQSMPDKTKRDYDAVVRKAVLVTLKIYGFTDFRLAELTNLKTNVRLHLAPDDVRAALTDCSVN